MDDLSKAMHEALTMPAETLQNMGDAAYAQMMARHDTDIEAAKLVEHFKASVNWFYSILLLCLRLSS